MVRPIVSVVGAGENATAAGLANAFRLGQLLAADGWIIVSGGRDAGIMREVNRGAKSIQGGLTVGILPSASSAVAPDVDVPIITDIGQARNNIIVLTSRVVIACGAGGAGTASELALAIKAGKPLILLAADEASQSFFKRLGSDRVQIADSPEAAVTLARQFQIE